MGRPEMKEKEVKETLYPRGVSRSGNRYLSNVSYKGRRIYLGSFKTPEEASTRYEMFREENPYPSKKRWQPGDTL